MEAGWALHQHSEDARTGAKTLRRFGIGLVWANVLVIALLATVAVVAGHNSKMADYAQTGEASANLATLLANDIASELRLIDNALSTVAATYKRVAADPTVDENLQLTLSEQKALLPQADVLRIAGADGWIRFGLPDGAQPVNVGDREYFLNARESPKLVVSEPLHGRVTNTWVVIVAKRLESRDGAFAGVVYTSLPAEYLANRFSRLNLGAGGAVSLRSGTMRLITRYAYGEAFSEKNIGSTTVSESLTAALRENGIEGRLVSKTALDGVERVSAYRRVPGYELFVLTGIATSHALQPWRQDVMVMGSLLACAGVAVALTSIAVFLKHRRAFLAERRVGELVKEQQVMLDNELIGMVKTRNRSSLWNNRAMELMFGYEPGELAGTPSRMLYADEETWHKVGTEGYEAIKAHGRYRTEVQMRRKDGSLIWIELYGAAVGPEDTMWMFVDMTSLKAREATLSRQALHDPLTGLANRTQLLAELQHILSMPHLDGTVTAVCYLDLDGFKAVNDSFGHAAGDEVLAQVAERMQKCVRSADLVARLGGDEFVVVLSLLQGVEQVKQVTRRLLDLICLPITLKSGSEALVATSVGVAMAPSDAVQAEQLLNLADAAMYEAKKAGKRQVRFARRA